MSVITNPRFKNFRGKPAAKSSQKNMGKIIGLGGVLGRDNFTVFTDKSHRFVFSELGLDGETKKHIEKLVPPTTGKRLDISKYSIVMVSQSDMTHSFYVIVKNKDVPVF